jgi:DNA-binding response OmpR family regulator
MTRILLIDGDRALAQAFAMECVENGVAIRMAETLCEGVRCLLDEPVSAVLVESTLMRLPVGEQGRLFDVVAPGVPVVVLMESSTRVDEKVKLELQGFRVMDKPFDLCDLLAKLPRPARVSPAEPGAAERALVSVCR